MINIDRDGVPWRSVAASLRQRIRDGEITGRLPSEKTLAQQYEVDVKTVRKALAQLREDGLIETERGWGSYVSGSNPPRQP